MADDFEKENSNFSFEENSNKNPEKLNNSGWTDNPFEKEAENPFAGQTQYQVSNENIDANRRQSNNLLKVLLALILSIGLLVAAIFGLSQKKNPTDTQPQDTQAQIKETQNPTPTSLPNQSSSANTAIDKEIASLKAKDRLSPAETDRLNELEKQKATIKAVAPIKPTNLKERKFCRLNEAQLFVSDAIGDLDRVTGKLEDRVDAYKSSDEDISDKELAFLRNKVEDLSRAEAEIQNFAQPHIDSDLSVGTKDNQEPCKLKDGPKHLAAWLDELKERINGLYADLDELAGEPVLASNEGALAETQLSETKPTQTEQTNTSVSNKAQPSIPITPKSEKTNTTKQALPKTSQTASNKAMPPTNKGALKDKIADTTKPANSKNQKAISSSKSSNKVLSLLPPSPKETKASTQSPSSALAKEKESKPTTATQAPIRKEVTPHNLQTPRFQAQGQTQNENTTAPRRTPQEGQRQTQAPPRRVERCFEYEEPSYSECEEYEEYYYEPAPRRVFQRRGYYY